MHKVRCKRCGKTFGYFGWGIFRHLKKVHNIKPTAKDYKYMRKHRLFLCAFPFMALLYGIKVLLCFILLPFHLLYQLLAE